MGADLIMKIDDKELFLGRAHNYKARTREDIHENIDTVNEIDVEVSYLKSEVSKFVSYSPKNIDELQQMNDDVDDLLDGFCENFEKTVLRHFLIKLFEWNPEHKIEFIIDG